MCVYTLFLGMIVFMFPHITGIVLHVVWMSACIRAIMPTRTLRSQDTLGSIGAEAEGLLNKTSGYRAGILRVALLV